MFQLALEPGETAMITLLSSTSSFFTLILASLFPSASGDKFTFSKLFAVFISISGVVSIIAFFHNITMKKMFKLIIYLGDDYYFGN